MSKFQDKFPDKFLEKKALVQTTWQRITAPIRRVFAPITAPIAAFTAPLRHRWTAFRQRHPIASGILGWTGWVIKWGFFAGLLLVFSVWIGVFGRLPNNEELRTIETANSTEIYTADSVLIGKYFIENRTAIGLDKISPYIVTAILATEDKRFFEHSGIDFMSWLRVFKGISTGQKTLGGGSTLSQQLAKNLYPRKNYHIPGISLLINKIKENIISIRLEEIYNKEDLLNLYLNTVPFGGQRYGVNVAARYFFNKKAKELSPDQSAMLIGMLKATTAYDPTRNPEEAKKQRDLVLLRMAQNSGSINLDADDPQLAMVRKMIENGQVTQKDYQELSKKPVGAKRYDNDGNNDGSGTYFREYLRTEVMPKLLKNYTKEDGSTYNLYTDGLKIYTTLHSKMQQFAEEAVQKHMQELQRQFNQHWKNYKKDKPWGDDKWIDQQVRRSPRWDALKDAGMNDADVVANFEKPAKMAIFSWKNGGVETDTIMAPIDSVRYYFCMLNCGFMAMDHRNGYIRAWVGGTNFRYFKYDHILSERQVGSTFKPIVYAAALQDSIKPCQYFPNQIKKIIDWEPHNADEHYGGWYSMSGGLMKSVNVIAAQLIEKVGIQKTIDLAAKMGVTSKLPREYGISLGAADIALYDMIKVYGTIANAGRRPEPVTVLTVIDRNGAVIYDYKKELAENPDLGPHVQALTPNQAATMTAMMENVINSGTGRRLRRYVSYDTDFAGKTGTTQNQSDGWFICFNPQLVTGAWVGAPSPAVRFRSMDLGQGSAMALPIVGNFWNKIANDRKMQRLLLEKFPDLKPEVQALLGCYPWIGIQPDSFNLLMQDTMFRDSMRSVGKNKILETPGGEGDGETPVKPEKGNDADKPKEEKSNIFKKIFGKKSDDEPKKPKQ